MEQRSGGEREIGRRRRRRHGGGRCRRIARATGSERGTGSGSEAPTHVRWEWRVRGRPAAREALAAGPRRLKCPLARLARALQPRLRLLQHLMPPPLMRHRRAVDRKSGAVTRHKYLLFSPAKLCASSILQSLSVALLSLSFPISLSFLPSSPARHYT
jgi:hypothetical protein